MKAISYIRISNRDQSNFSISGQQEYIRLYCERKGITLINSFLDNGQSAKNFDRADWKKLEQFVKENHSQIDHLIVVKYDRFSRNVSEGLAMIDKLEKKYSITILSVFEEIAISPDSPFFFKMRTDMLVQAEFELRVIRDRTQFGIRQAKREGRYVNRAPYGYLNARDDKNKPILKIDPDRAAIVRRVFDLFLETNSIQKTHKEVRKLGYKQGSNSAITRILKNPAYVGLLKLDGQLVKGAHDPIIPMPVFNHVQQYFRRSTSVRVLINDEVPLRGVLRCECGRLLTAGKSKGKTKHYWYYKCKAHLEINFSASQVHEKFRELLFDISLTEQAIEKIRLRSEQIIKERLSNQQKSVPGIRRQIAETEKKVLMLEEKFILGQIEFSVYSSWNAAYHTELNSLKNNLRAASEVGVNIWTRHRAVKELTSLVAFYDRADTLSKQRLVNLVFNRGLSYRLNSFITANILEIFKPNVLKANKKGLLLISNPEDDSEESTICSGNGSIVELFNLLEAV